MIETKISKDIWNLKYRFNEETEGDFYTRPVVGLFGKLVHEDEEMCDKYFKIAGVGDMKEAYIDLGSVFADHRAMLAGRPMYSLGTERMNQTLSNCFVIPVKKDSLSAIMDAAKDAAMTMKAGGGVGYNFSILRPKYSLINSSGAQSTGVLSFMNIFNTTCSTIEAGGNRRGAQIAVLGIWHPDVLEYITCKRKGDGLPDEYKPYKNFNLSIYTSDDFMDAVREDALWDLVFPDTQHEAYDAEWDGNIKAWKEKGYPVEVHNTVKAKELWDKIMKSNYEFAEPGILFEDTINNLNTLWMEEYILACNPCGEQPLVAYGSCNLGSINLTKFVDEPFGKAGWMMGHLRDTVKKMVVMMDRMLDVNYYPLPQQLEIVQQKRQIGLGITGLGDMLAMMRLKYSSPEARVFVGEVMENIRNTAFETSIELARELGPFPLWNEFTDEQKQQFINGDYISTLPDRIKEDILKYGLRNSRLLSIAPCGTISLLMNNVSSGAEPIFLLEYDRKVKTSNEETVTETVETYAWRKYKEYMSGVDNLPVPDYFETTEDLQVEDHIEMQAVLQLKICTAISKTINIPVDYPYEQFKQVYDSAYINGLKGCTTYRPNSILGSVLSKKGDNGCGEQRPEEITFMCAPKRPKSLDCEIHHCTVKGQPWLVIVGMYKDNPYEIFAGEGDDLYIPKSIKEGKIVKRGKGTYSLIIQTKKSEVEFKDVAHDLMTVEQRAMTRLVSLSLRHGVPHEFVVKQLRKSSGDITDFSAVINRVLNTYIKEAKYEKEEECPECDDGILIREVGCMNCKNCGYSKCG